MSDVTRITDGRMGALQHLDASGRQFLRAGGGMFVAAMLLGFGAQLTAAPGFVLVGHLAVALNGLLLVWLGLLWARLDLTGTWRWLVVYLLAAVSLVEWVATMLVLWLEHEQGVPSAMRGPLVSLSLYLVVFAVEAVCLLLVFGFWTRRPAGDGSHPAPRPRT